MFSAPHCPRGECQVGREAGQAHPLMPPSLQDQYLSGSRVKAAVSLSHCPGNRACELGTLFALHVRLVFLGLNSKGCFAHHARSVGPFPCLPAGCSLTCSA